MSQFSWKNIFFDSRDYLGFREICEIIRNIITEYGIGARDVNRYSVYDFIAGGYVIKEFLDVLFSNGLSIHYHMMNKDKTLNYLWPCITIKTVEKNLKGIMHLILKLLEVDKDGIYALLRVSDIHHINNGIFLVSQFDMNDMYLIEYTIMLFTFMVRLEIFHSFFIYDEHIQLILPVIQALEHHKQKRYQASLFTLMYFDLKRNKEF